jgi:hypothetical protein
MAAFARSRCDAYCPLRNHSAIGPDAEPFPGFSKMVNPRRPINAQTVPAIHQSLLTFDKRKFAALGDMLIGG